MESIARSINSALQLSGRGGGAFWQRFRTWCESGALTKKIQNQSSGVVPVMKLLEDSFRCANPAGRARARARVVPARAPPGHHAVLDTKRENADEKIRIKTRP